MIQAYTVKELLTVPNLVSKEVKLRGWLKSRRDSKNGLSFLTVYDGSSIYPIQVIARGTLANYYSEILNTTKDCAIEVNGELIFSLGNKQKVEIKANKIVILGWIKNPETYPMSLKHHTVEHLRNHAHLRARTNLIGAVSRVRHKLAKFIHNFFENEGFLWVNTPILTSNDCEGAGELFHVSTTENKKSCYKVKKDKKGFFDGEAFLTVSGQLNVETYCMALSKVYTFGPTFRAENSNTSRHLAEFWMVEPEFAFANLNDATLLAEKLIKSVIRTIIDECLDDLKFFDQFVEKGLIHKLHSLVVNKFVQIDYSDAIQILKNCKERFEYPIGWGLDLQSEHERFLCEKYFESPVILKNHPESIKAFYMRLNDDKKTVASMDVLIPSIGEIIGGGQREERLDKLEERMTMAGINTKKLDWYCDLRRYGTAEHSGFGMGFERLMNYITGLTNIQDVIPFPRTLGNMKF